MKHPLHQFIFCPVCGEKTFVENNEKSKICSSCGFVYYFNPSSSVACFIRNPQGEILTARRAKEPAKGTLDLPGGFVDRFETGEDAAKREIHEETGLIIDNTLYLFSLPNIYLYKGFEVHTLDLYYECIVPTFEGVIPQDDVSELIVMKLEQLTPEAFGLDSIQKAVHIYLERNK